MATIQVDIVSAEGEIHSGDAAMVFAPASMGEVGIAPRHAPMLTTLKPGEVRVQDADGNEEAFYITGGMLEVQPNRVTVLADTALRGDQLDAAAALAAQQQAEKALEARPKKPTLLAHRPSLPKLAPVIVRRRSSRASASATPLGGYRVRSRCRRGRQARAADQTSVSAV